MNSEEAKILNDYKQELLRLHGIVLELNSRLDHQELEQLPELIGRKENAFVSLQILGQRPAFKKLCRIRMKERTELRQLMQEILNIEEKNRDLVIQCKDRLQEEMTLVKRQKRNYQQYLCSFAESGKSEVNLTS